MSSPPQVFSLRRWAAAGPLLVVLAVALVVTWVRPETGPDLGGLGLALGNLIAGTLVLRRSRQLDSRERAAWRYLAAGMYLVATGVIVVGVLTQLGISVPAFGPHDIFFLTAYLALIITLYRLARSDGEGQGWLLTVIDALVGAVALSVLVWTTFLHDMVDVFSGAPPMERAIALTYPVLDIAAVIGLTILVIRRSHFRWDPRLVFLAGGLLFQVFADFLYLRAGVGRSFIEAEPVFPLFLLATMGYVGAAAMVDRVPRKREFPERTAPVVAVIWPYLLAAALLTTHVARYRSLSPTADEALMLDALIAIVVIVFLRQMLMIRRNRTRVDSQRSALVASVSHELRTPLTAMVGYLTLLDESGEEFPEEVRREMLSEATHQARHMAILVSDLVMLARDHSQVSLEITETSMSQIMTQALRGIEPGDTRIKEMIEADPPLRVDPDRVRQAVANLITNAVRYGEDRVVIVRKFEDRDLILEVHDNGPGVPTRHEASIWMRFERGAHRLDAATPGIGIGLAIVQAIAEAHGGKAEYRRSERLGGACFSLTIPGCVFVRGPELEYADERN